MITIHPKKLDLYRDIYTTNAQDALAHMAELNSIQKEIMRERNERRRRRIETKSHPDFLDESVVIGPKKLKVADIRAGNFKSSQIPKALQRQWIQGTGPAARPKGPLESSLRNVAYALLSGADGWMFDGEDALGQINCMSLDNQRNLKLAIHRDPLFLQVASKVAEEMNAWSTDFLGKVIIQDWKKQLDFTTVLFRARGLHLDDRHITSSDGESFSASITDTTLYVVNNYERLLAEDRPVVLYLPKIQVAEEAAFWNTLLERLETYLDLPIGIIKVYVLVEQLEASFQLMEIRAALGEHFVGYNTGRWDYINSVADALCGIKEFINPNIESIGMTYSYMAAYEDRVRRAVNTPDVSGNYSLWQGGMEPNIPVGSKAGVALSMEKAIAGARREQSAGASGKWVAHWKMVHIIRPVWEDLGEWNQLAREFDALTYTPEDRKALTSLEPAPTTIRGARNLISVALQYGNAFLQGFQAAALKPADFFGNEDILYLMEDMATGEIRVSVLWEWVHKEAVLTEPDHQLELEAGELFTKATFDLLLLEEYNKLIAARDKDVHEDSKSTTLPISLEVVSAFVSSEVKAPWLIDLLNLNLNNTNLEVARERIREYYHELETSGNRLTQNMEIKELI